MLICLLALFFSTLSCFASSCFLGKLHWYVVFCFCRIFSMTCARLKRLFVVAICFFLRFGLAIYIKLDVPNRFVVLLMFFSFEFTNFVSSFFIAFVALGYHICVSWFCLFLSPPCLFCCFSFAFVYSNVKCAPWFPFIPTLDPLCEQQSSLPTWHISWRWAYAKKPVLLTHLGLFPMQSTCNVCAFAEYYNYNQTHIVLLHLLSISYRIT